MSALDETIYDFARHYGTVVLDKSTELPNDVHARVLRFRIGEKEDTKYVLVFMVNGEVIYSDID